MKERTVWQALWVIVLVAGVLDIATTYVGLENGLAETNPLAKQVLNQFGFAAMAGLKAVAIGGAYLASTSLTPKRWRLLTPALLSLIWVVVVISNTFFILQTA